MGEPESLGSRPIPSSWFSSVGRAGPADISPRGGCARFADCDPTAPCRVHTATGQERPMRERTGRGPRQGWAPSPRLLRPLRAAGCVVAGLLAVGCVSTGPVGWVQNGFKVGPNYHRPPAPAASEWIEAQDARVPGQDPRGGDWGSVVQDPGPHSLI